MESKQKCRCCKKPIIARSLSKKFCDRKCKTKFNKKNGRRLSDGGICRQCGKNFPRTKGQNAKSICSKKCRMARLAESVRNFHLRRPQMQAIYRQRSREKVTPDGNIVRFYKWNPHAPRRCEACGEDRVLEIAHKPGHERCGEHRSKKSCEWPQKVWVLCPTCHRLLDRMNYSPAELSLSL